MAYLGKTPSQAVRSRYYYTATGGETSLSGADDNSNVLTFTDGNYVDVSLNGVALVAGTDYNTTTANTIGGLTALVASDVVEVIVYDTFSVFSGNVTGDFTVGGTLTAANITNTGNLNFGDNDKAIFGAGSDLQIYHDGSQSYIKDVGTGQLRFAASDILFSNAAVTENIMFGAQDGAVTLYHNGAAKLATTATGVDITGTVVTDGFELNTLAIGGDTFGVVKSANNTAAGFEFLGDSSGTKGARVYYEGNGNLFTIAENTSGTIEPRLVIDDSGNVGIGTSSPSVALQVKGANSPIISQSTSTGAGPNYLKFIDSASTELGYVGYGAANNSLYLVNFSSDPIIFYNSSEKMRIDSSGNLLVGRTSVGGTGNGHSIRGGDSAIFSRDAVGETMQVGRNASAGDLIRFNSNGTLVGTIGTDGALNIGSTNTGIKFGTSAVWATTGGSTNSNGAKDLGASTARWQNLYLSGGVYLGGTGSANLLDDYEEGSFVPYVSLTYNPNGRTITDNGAGVGRYTKIGNTVYCEIKVAWTGISGSGSRNVGINNLPFTKATDITVVNGAGRSNINGYMYQMESVTGTTVNVIRRYDNGTPLDVDNIDCFIVYRAA
jgi:hypothetical protein